MDFLKPSVNQIRKSIKDIDDSYNNDWDILSELIQNSVDAVRNVNNPIIKLTIDCSNKSISIIDNGVGISPDKLPNLLKPFSSDKENDETMIGEKGVGLTFTIFQSNEFYIKSGNKDGCAEGKIKDAKTWKNLSDETPLVLDYKKTDEQFFGTLVELKKLGDIKLFNWTYEQLKFILRTKTALGNSLSLFGQEFKINFELSFINFDGIENNSLLNYSYLVLTELLDRKSIISLDDFIKYASEPTITDRQKRKKLQDKVITDIGEFDLNDNRKIKYYSLFVPKRKVWDDFSIKAKLATHKNLENLEWVETFNYTIFHNGITMSVKGMPTGIFITHPDTGYAGYWSNMFIIFEDPKLKFDIGRKSIHGQTAQRFRKLSKEIFNKYLKYVTKYVSGAIPTGQSEWNKDDIFAEIESLLDLEVQDIKLKKTPKDQEASVAALFFECIGNNKIRDLIPLTSGYRNRYDLFAKWGNKKIVIEFKARLSSILRDFNDAQKFFDEVDCVICWNVDEDDKQSFKDWGIELSEITNNELYNSNEEFPNATHRLDLANVNPVYVIDLKKIINAN